ncbi:MAG: hypothetical protein Q4B43_08830 [Bacteroidota bacterium]|nr:hypothetical protein [Bacteroidota bacterium]
MPTEQLAKDSIIELIKTESNDKVELLEFKKTDGMSSRRDEVDYYQLDFEGQISYKQGGFYLGESYGKTKGFLKVVDKEPNRYAYNFHLYEKVEKDETKDIKGYIAFIKKESGWKRNDVYMTFKK